MSDCKQASPIAIVGMACIFPGAANLQEFWQNIVDSRDSLKEAGEQEWDAAFYRNKNSSAFGKIYCSRGGFITEHAYFDPLEFGIMPAAISGADPDQFLALRVAADALRDAGYQHKNFEQERAEIIIGRTMAPGVGSLNLIQHGQTVDQLIAVLRALQPELSESDLEKIADKLHESLNPCSSDTIPGVMPNILSGRIAAKLGFKGRNLILDAACASSLIAVETAIQGLLSGQSDLAIAGAVHVNSSPYFYQMFCELGALSPRSEIRPFDQRADGTILGEGVGMVVLKRLEDALSDKNKIYALIRGIGSSSDGKGGGSLAPSLEGEALAMRRAYQMAGISASTVELLEAHGTATPLGDKVEMQAVSKIFAEDREANGKPGQPKAVCAIGSVKANIGHTQAASGIAGLIKAAMALNYKILPASFKLDNPSDEIDWSSSPCYVNEKSRSWTGAEAGKRPYPRRAAVSAFGFGGVNAHAVLEEFDPENSCSPLSVEGKARGIKLCLRYPELNPAKLTELTAKRPPAKPAAAAAAPAVASPRIALSAGNNLRASAKPEFLAANNAESEELKVLSSYMQSLSEFQKKLLGVQERVMIDYLQSTPEDLS